MQDINKLNNKRLIKKFQDTEDRKIAKILVSRGYYSFVIATLKIRGGLMATIKIDEIKKPTGGVITTAELAK